MMPRPLTVSRLTRMRRSRQKKKEYRYETLQCRKRFLTHGEALRGTVLFLPCMPFEWHSSVLSASPCVTTHGDKHIPRDSHGIRQPVRSREGRARAACHASFLCGDVRWESAFAFIRRKHRHERVYAVAAQLKPASRGRATKNSNGLRRVARRPAAVRRRGPPNVWAVKSNPLHWHG
jgi:hypothetical protein